MVDSVKFDELVIYREFKDGYVTAKYMVGDESCGILRMPAKTWGLYKTALQAGAVPIVGKPPILKVSIRGPEATSGGPTPVSTPTTAQAVVEDDLLSIVGE